MGDRYQGADILDTLLLEEIGWLCGHHIPEVASGQGIWRGLRVLFLWIAKA